MWLASNVWMLTIDLFFMTPNHATMGIVVNSKGVVIEKLIDETFLAFLQTAWSIRAFVPTVADDSLANVPTPQMSWRTYLSLSMWR